MSLMPQLIESVVELRGANLNHTETAAVIASGEFEVVTLNLGRRGDE